MKKFFSLVLALVMALSLTTIAWGADIDSMAELNAAIAAANDGDTITLTGNIADANAIITIDKAITLDGAGKTLTSTAGRAINVNCAGEVTIKNLTVVASGERAINVITQPATLTIENVTATAGNYALNVATSAGATNITVKESSFSAPTNTVQVAAPGASVTLVDCTIASTGSNANEVYGALTLGKEAPGAQIIATGCTITVADSDSSKGKLVADDGVILIDGSEAGVVKHVAYIPYGNNYKSYATIQEAIDYAEANSAPEVILMQAAVNSGESFTPAAGVDLVLPADTDANMVTLPNGEAVVVTPATFSGTTAITTSFKEDGTYYVLYNGIWDEVTYVPADDNGDGTGNVAYFEGDLANYVICKKNDDDALKLTSGFLAGDKLLNYVKVSEVEYTAVGTKVDASLKINCTTDMNAKGYKVVDATTGAVTYWKDPATGVTPTKWLLVNKEIKGVVPQVEVTDYVMGGHALIQNKAAAKDAAKTVFEYKCVICGTLFDGTKTKTAGVTYTNYFMPNAATKTAYNDNGYDMSDVTTGDLYLISTKVPSAGGTTTTDKVTSAETFDAGIAMYVGMSVMAAAGSAVVIGKKKD